MAFPSRGFDWCYRINCLRNYLRKLERRPKWQHIRFTYDILSFLWSVQPLRVTPAYTGEKHCACFRRTHSRGSPPRMRGKELLPGHYLPGSGDHPRACGEKHKRGPLDHDLLGSPPRMRGKVWWAVQQLRSLGITPAHAGKSSSCSWCSIWCEDHPRACGEKKQVATLLCATPGSPPRMRGKAQPGRENVQLRRITPAHAGKSAVRGRAEMVAEDHPRACGEKCFWG